jgi:hypothetical protein
MNYYLGFVAVASHGLVYAVVDYLVDQVMQAVLVGAADIHARAASNRFQAIQNPDIFGGIVLLSVVDIVFSFFLRHSYRKPFYCFGVLLEIRD